MPLFGFRDVIGAKEGPILLTISVPNMNGGVCATDGRSHGLDRLQHIRIFFQKARTYHPVVENAAHSTVTLFDILPRHTLQYIYVMYRLVAMEL